MTRVLVVEDEESYSDALAYMLRKEGFDVSIANTGPDALAEFERAGAVVLGVSPDDEKSHVKFRDKYELPFALLADPDHAVAERYGVWGEKKYMGRTYLGVMRSTFVIGADGNVKRVLHDVKPATHADDVLAILADG